MTRTMMGILAVGVAAGALGALVLSSDGAVAAPRQKTITYDDATVRATHGSFSRLPDGGFVVECCGEVRQLDGGAVPLNSPCVSEQAGALGSSFTACVTAWRSTNEF